MHEHLYLDHIAVNYFESDLNATAKGETLSIPWWYQESLHGDRKMALLLNTCLSSCSPSRDKISLTRDGGVESNMKLHGATSKGNSPTTRIYDTCCGDRRSSGETGALWLMHSSKTGDCVCKNVIYHQPLSCGVT